MNERKNIYFEEKKLVLRNSKIANQILVPQDKTI